MIDLSLFGLQGVIVPRKICARHSIGESLSLAIQAGMLSFSWLTCDFGSMVAGQSSLQVHVSFVEIGAGSSPEVP